MTISLSLFHCSLSGHVFSGQGQFCASKLAEIFTLWHMNQSDILASYHSPAHLFVLLLSSTAVHKLQTLSQLQQCPVHL